MEYDGYLEETLQNLKKGEEMMNTEKYDEAIICYSTAFDLQKDKCGVEHPTTVNCAFQLGTAYLFMGKFKEAQETLEDMLGVVLKLFGYENQYTANFYYMIGTCQMQLQDYECAAASFGHLVTISNKVFGEKSEETATANAIFNKVMALKGGNGEEEDAEVNSIEDAEECFTRGAKNFDDGLVYLARKYFLRAVELKEATGEEDEHLVHFYRGLSMADTDLDMNKEAIETLEKLLALSIKLYGEVSDNVSGTHNLMGYNYMIMDKLDMAIEHMNKGISISIKVFGEKSLEVVRDYNLLANMYGRNGEDDKAIATYIIVENLCSGITDPQALGAVLNAYDNIIALYMSNEKYNDAMEYEEKKLHVCSHAFGENSKQVLTVYNEMLYVSQALHDDEKIAELLMKIDEVRKNIGSDDSCDCGCHDHEHHHHDDDCDSCCHHHDDDCDSCCHHHNDDED